MAEWKDELIDLHITPIIEIISGDVDPDFSRIDFVAWFESGVTSFSYRVFDGGKKKIIIKLSDPVVKRDDDIRHHVAYFRDGFLEHNEAWVALRVEVTASGAFDIDFDYDDPYKFDFRREKR